jgi:hypothetical protein
VAVITVVLYHVNVAPDGFLEVDVFFASSGFLITGLLRNECVRTAGLSNCPDSPCGPIQRPWLCASSAFLVAAVSGQVVGAMVHDAVPLERVRR